MLELQETVEKTVNRFLSTASPDFRYSHPKEDLIQDALVAILSRRPPHLAKESPSKQKAWARQVTYTFLVDVYSAWLNQQQLTVFESEVTVEIDEQTAETTVHFIDSVTPEKVLLFWEAYQRNELPEGHAKVSRSPSPSSPRKPTLYYIEQAWEGATSITQLFYEMRKLGWQGAYLTLRTVLKKCKLKPGKIFAPKNIKGGLVMQVKKEDIEQLKKAVGYSEELLKQAFADQVFTDYVKQYLQIESPDNVPEDKLPIVEMLVCFWQLQELSGQDLPAKDKQKVTKLLSKWENVIAHVTEMKPVEVIDQAPRQAKVDQDKSTKPAAKPAKRTGIVATIREIFESGKHTVDEVAKELESRGIQFSMATVRTQVGKLRKEKGLSTQRRQSGVVAKIRELWEAGIRTKAEICQKLEEEGIQFSVATVNTQLARLKKQERQAQA